MERFVCIHGHFYQPPRENPWLGKIEPQESAAPYHDWNERITEECYRPNARAKVLDETGRVARMSNNYARISFNFGPTLLSWLAEEAQDVYAAVIEADRMSAERFSGYGSAIAQAYNHIIMPLANSRDKYTQVLWGLRDFQHRFGRKPEGMWLPETAVDLESLDAMASLGIAFTVLEPAQASRIRPEGSDAWENVSESGIDPTRAYYVSLPSGRPIAVFFYDGPVSRAVAFEALLTSGEKFADRLFGGLSDARDWPQVMSIATDGESYGHHHKFGEMALAYALGRIETGDEATLTNYAEYLSKHPPEYEVEILEGTSWSCEHGVERWRSNCGCNAGRGEDWHQEWRGPLREALDWLRDAVTPLYEREGARYLRDPWEARNEYISLMLDSSDASIEAFFAAQGKPHLPREDWQVALSLLELQEYALFMYTSCGWFFDEVSGIETVQVLRYAARVVQLAEVLFHEPMEEEFLERLSRAKSNVAEYGDGRGVYEAMVRPAMAGGGAPVNARTP